MTRSSQMLSNNLHLVDHDIKDKQRDQNKSFVKIFFFKFTGTSMLLNSWENNKSLREKGKCISNMKNNYYFVPGVKNVVVLRTQFVWNSTIPSKLIKNTNIDID